MLSKEDLSTIHLALVVYTKSLEDSRNPDHQTGWNDYLDRLEKAKDNVFALLLEHTL